MSLSPTGLLSNFPFLGVYRQALANASSELVFNQEPDCKKMFSADHFISSEPPIGGVHAFIQ